MARYKVTYCVFSSDSDNTAESSFAYEFETDTNNYRDIHEIIDEQIQRDDSYRGYKIVSLTAVEEEESENASQEPESSNSSSDS